MTEKPKQPSVINIPSRTSSHQRPSDPNPAVPEPPPSPRRGSKRSLLGRSRNNSKSSRRSLRAARAAESKEPVPPLPQNAVAKPEKKARNGFLAFLSCCSSSDFAEDAKSDDPDVAAKKIKIQPQPQRTARPQDQNEVVENEKTLEGNTPVDDSIAQGKAGNEELSEKRAPEEAQSTLPKEPHHDKVTIPGASGILPAAPLAQQGTGPRSDEDQIKSTTVLSHK